MYYVVAKKLPNPPRKESDEYTYPTTLPSYGAPPFPSLFTASSVLDPTARNDWGREAKKTTSPPTHSGRGSGAGGGS